MLLISVGGQPTETITLGHPHIHVANTNREGNLKKPSIWHFVCLAAQRTSDVTSRSLFLCEMTQTLVLILRPYNSGCWILKNKLIFHHFKGSFECYKWFHLCTRMSCHWYKTSQPMISQAETSTFLFVLVIICKITNRYTYHPSTHPQIISPGN